MIWVWGSFWIEDLRESKAGVAIFAVPWVALFWTTIPSRHSWRHRVVTGLALGLLPLWVFLCYRTATESNCTFTSSYSYDRALTWTATGYVVLGLSRWVSWYRSRLLARRPT